MASMLPAVRTVGRIRKYFEPRRVFPTGPLPPSWFAGHMAKAIRLLQKHETLSSVDLVVEVRDARIPISSRNPVFDTLMEDARSSKLVDKGHMPKRLIVYCKRDLADENKDQEIINAHSEYLGEKAIFVNTVRKRDIRMLLRTAIELLETSKPISQIRSSLNNKATGNEIQLNGRTSPTEGYTMLITGIPNVGKSTLINSLRTFAYKPKYRPAFTKGNVVKTGKTPGVTRNITGVVKVCPDPLLYVYDTPGITMPYLGAGHSGWIRSLKLALTSSIKDSLIDPISIADYLLFHLNLHLFGGPIKHSIPDCLAQIARQSKYPTNDIDPFLEAIASNRKMILKGGILNTHEAAVQFIEMYRDGKLGRFDLDEWGTTADERKKNLELIFKYGVKKTPLDQFHLSDEEKNNEYLQLYRIGESVSQARLRKKHDVKEAMVRKFQRMKEQRS